MLRELWFAFECSGIATFSKFFLFTLSIAPVFVVGTHCDDHAFVANPGKTEEVCQYLVDKYYSR